MRTGCLGNSAFISCRNDLVPSQLAVETGRDACSGSCCCHGIHQVVCNAAQLVCNRAPRFKRHEKECMGQVRFRWAVNTLCATVCGRRCELSMYTSSILAHVRGALATGSDPASLLAVTANEAPSMQSWRSGSLQSRRRVTAPPSGPPYATLSPTR